jgi:hypothetical protein
VLTPIDYVDFTGVDAILSDSSSQICDEIHMAEGKAVLSKSDGVVAELLEGFFMACGRRQGTREAWQVYTAMGVCGALTTLPPQILHE